MQPQPPAAGVGAGAEPGGGLGLVEPCPWGSGARSGLGLRMGARSAQAAPLTSLCLLHLLQKRSAVCIRKCRGAGPSEPRLSPESGFGVPGPRLGD